MPDRNASENAAKNSIDNTSDIQGPSPLPSISLPKGGGAIRGIGEKFNANSVTGTASLNVPIYTSPGRSAFGPQLSLSYDSGAGNGPFGFGWNLSLPMITRKTDKGLPKYRDAEESDIFILSGAEDLVPVFKKDDKGEWKLDENGNYIIDEDPDRDGYIVRRYRPRIEGLFARIERWIRRSDGDTHWRSISKDNILTVYGRDKRSRICDPSDKSRVFSWLICESYDDKGNAIVYEYAPENDKGIDLSKANEQNRIRTANRYIKRIWYGNRQPLLININNPSFRKSHIEQPDLSSAEWMFEVVFDYVGENHYIFLPLDDSLAEVAQHRYVQASANVSLEGNVNAWLSRPDPFSAYRAGFEVRTYRRCQRVLMFHRFPAELGDEPYLVRSTEFDYSDFEYLQEGEEHRLEVKTELEYKGSTRFASFIHLITQSGYILDDTKPMRVTNGVKYRAYLKKSFPPLEFDYSPATIHEDIKEVDSLSLENLPLGLDGTLYNWVDLDGEGLSGILTEQGGAWFYKRNISSSPAIGEQEKVVDIAKFAPIECLKHVPSSGSLGTSGQQLMDLSGDGQLDLVQFNGSLAGFFERTTDEKWNTFVPFTSLPNVRWDDPNLKFIDLTGDGHADIMIAEDYAFVWYPSLAERGFAEDARKIHQSLDEEKGPRLVFADGSLSIYLTDMSGDGMTDLVRIRNGEVCYWPNLGYGRFGAKVTMDNPPWFDTSDQFDQRRIRLADIDGSGVSDIIYLSGGNGIHIYFNQSGNRWSDAYTLPNFPHIGNNLSYVQVADLLGSGTACLIWSSPMPNDFGRSMRYIDFMHGKKPHLMVSSKNNLGAETRVHYASSTKFYVADKITGKPWITRLSFPVYVVERIETYDWISRNRFVTRYAYHHGYFDAEDREFRGFGMVEQWDTEEFATLSNSDTFPTSDNNIPSSHVPPVHTKTWFHTGIFLGHNHVSDYFAGIHGGGEYYREPKWLNDDVEARKHLLDDTVLPAGLTWEEEREACRALKGLMLRQEVYALDDTDKAQHPYLVTEQNFTIKVLQPRGSNNNKINFNSVFFTHARETINYHYERNPADPLISHVLTLEVGEFGNTLKQATIGYGRRQPDRDLILQVDRNKQTQRLITYTETYVTNAIMGMTDCYRTPLSCESRTYELTGYTPSGSIDLFSRGDFVEADPNIINSFVHIYDREINYDEHPSNGKERRLIEHVRTLYRKNDLTALLPLGVLESLALQGENYKLAFTSRLLTHIYHRQLNGPQLENLLPNPTEILTGQGSDKGGYLLSQDLKIEGFFPKADANDCWWIPEGQTFYSTNEDTAAQELALASQHFFLAKRYSNPFSKNTIATFDTYDLLMIETRDPLGNRMTAGERDAAGNIISIRNNYRVLQPHMVMDFNRNRTAVAFDALGMIVGTAIMGKPTGQREGDSLTDFETDLVESDKLDHISMPLQDPNTVLQHATARLIYDLFAFYRTRDLSNQQPPVIYILSRQTHVSDLEGNAKTKVQHNFSYSDGFGREIQKKIQAKHGPLDLDDSDTSIIEQRWIGSGWTIFNNKGKPIRQYRALL